MSAFFKKTSPEYKRLNDYFLAINGILSKDKYISKKEYINTYESLKELVDKLSSYDKDGILIDWCKKNRVNYKKLLTQICSYNDTKKEVDKHNNEFIERHLKSDKEYLDKVLLKDDPRIKLDDEQRRVVLSDEDYTLVIAGAGAGKTTTIEAKVKYLVDKQKVDPERVLIVSFTRKATDELRERFKRIKLPVKIATFHSIGNEVIKDSENVKYKVVDRGYMYKIIKDYLINNLKDEFFVKKVLLFFASYLNMPFESNNASLLFKSLRANDNTTLKSDIANLLDEYHKEQTQQKITINDERVRSVDECRIANYLFIKGIDYEYEPIYQYGFKDTTKPYCPDFLIKYKGKKIYLEHFGISESGENSLFSEKEIEEYKKHVNDKIKLHREHKTKLIYTFSKYNDGKDLISHLETILKKEGIEFDEKSDFEIYKALATKAEDKYFNKFIQLICTFINRFKVSNYDSDTKFDEWQYSIKSERTKLFLEICKICFNIYEAQKTRDNAIDFEDMINNAALVLDKKIENGEKLPYDYILVDEYQDISLQRFDLCEKLSKVSDAKIVAVGDDWQSIFRFTGSRIELFTEFEKKMSYANVLKITRTYRNSQELINIAGGFVMQNKKQIKKDLKSDKSIKDPVILMSYDDSYEKDNNMHGPLYRLCEAVEKSLDDIVAKCGDDGKVLLIGRYNFDGKNLTLVSDFFTYENGKLQSKKYPKLNIIFLTAHASKGLGMDNVIIINGKDDLLGFPSKIEDDPVMKLVIKDDEKMEYDEERRLFYVALTRTKNRVYIITPQIKTSKFIAEIRNSFTNICLKGEDLRTRYSIDLKYKCPICGYPLQKRQSKYKFLLPSKKLWICSNEPEVCGFLTNDLNGNYAKFSICKCPQCYDGFLIVKKVVNGDESNKESRMLGCTNYKKDGNGCNFSMYEHNYTQDKSMIVQDSKGRVIRSEYKSIINNILLVISNIYSKKYNFKFNYKSMINFLLGKEDNVIEKFRLNEEEGFGSFNENESSKLKLIIEYLFDYEIIKREKNEKGYESIVLVQPSIRDNQIIDLENSILKYKNIER